MKRGRKALSPPEKIVEDLVPSRQKDAAEEAQLKRMTRALTADQLAFSETCGAFKGLTFVEKTVTVTRIKMLLQWRDSKKYKGLAYTDPAGNLSHVTDFAGLCDALGISYETANRYIQSFKILGEEFMESAQQLGIGITTLRQLSKLPED